MMKEFEKWCQINNYSFTEECMLQRAWIAALEWALRNVEKHDINYEFVMLLKEELEN